MKKLRLAALAALAISLAGCASGPPFSEVSSTFPALAAGQGRIFFYRVSGLGAAIQPDVKVNDVEVGSAVPSGFFYIDRAPGSYTVTTTTEVKRALTMSLAAGETRYVRLNISMGLFAGHVWPELVDEATGAKEIQKTKAIIKK